MKTMAKLVVHLAAVTEVNSGAGIHLQFVEDPIPEEVMTFLMLEESVPE